MLDLIWQDLTREQFTTFLCWLSTASTRFWMLLPYQFEGKTVRWYSFEEDVIIVSNFIQWRNIYTEMKNKNGNPKIYGFLFLVSCHRK